jgi:small subunit ribosomal protein S19e
MAKVYDVPPDVLISKLADVLKNEDIPAPSWTSFRQTSSKQRMVAY